MSTVPDRPTNRGLWRGFMCWYFAPAPAERLALLRLAIGGYATTYLTIRTPHLLSYAALPQAQFEAVGVVTLLNNPLPSWLYQSLVWLNLALALIFTSGYRFRWVGPCFALMLLWVLSYSNSWQKVLHTDNLLWFQVVVLASSRAGDRFAIGATKPSQEPQAGMRYGWPLRLLCLLTIASYWLAGVAKLRHSGLAFLDGQTLRNYIAFGNLRKIALGSIHSPLGVWSLRFPFGIQVMAALSLLMELLAPLALIGRRSARLWVGMIWAFHCGVLALMAIAFVYPLSTIAFWCFFQPERWRWLQHARKRLTNPKRVAIP